MAAGAPNHGDELYCPTCEQTFARGERCPADNTRLVRIAQTKDQLIGRELEGRYTITQQLGAGGMGAVYRGTQHQLGREVAIKVVTPSLVKEPIIIKRFLREAKLASRLSHPNAVSVLDFGQTDDGLFFLVMELVAGRTLEEIIVKEGRLAPARVVRIGAQICDALEGAHALQIIHRDLKPQNVMVMATGRDLVKVLDFGLAKSLSPDQSVSTMTMTNAGALLGTPAFMPPELVNGQDCDARSDLYSLGCVLYACAAGRLPFNSTSVHEVIAAHASDPPPRIRDIPLRLWSIIEKLLEKDPIARYQSAAETREALEASLAERPDTEQEAPPNIEKATMLGWDSKPSARGSAARPRISTPASGVAPQKISITPVPIPADEVARLASSATMLSDSPASRPAPLAAPKKIGWKSIALVLAAAIVAAVIAFVVVDHASRKPKHEPAPSETTSVQPAANTDTKSEPPTTGSAIKVETAPPSTPSTAVDTSTPTPTKVEMPSTTKVETKTPSTMKVETKATPTTPKQTKKSDKRDAKKPAKQDAPPAEVAPPRRPVKTNPGVL